MYNKKNILYRVFMKNLVKKGFTLIEIIVATSILTIAVFWVFKLIWENNKILSTSQNSKNAYLLFQPMVSCIQSKGKNTMKTVWNTVYLNFGTNKNECLLSPTQENVFLDNIEYELRADLVNETSDYILWDLVISWETISDINLQYYQK